ncbi:nucleotidyl transferase AbiEii/AbiGii toxin family protein [Candidatus Woesearchaeota archaeon]|nr:nucleotidyl transferase AbiEii/AbiGii toxin family protein [Candidatus Woesearchaeota archaeon]
MEQLQLREKEIFETLKKIKKNSFVVIGGYAVNAYTFPRFSVDCDIVIKDHEELESIEEALLELGYQKVNNSNEIPYNGNFERYEKKIQHNFRVSMDILIEEVVDRQTNAKLSAEWIFDNSTIRSLKGKTISEELKIRIINSDALFVMKMLSCRLTDIRDLFLLISFIQDAIWIKKEVAARYNFKERLEKVIKEITSKQFKDGLQGVFGLIDNRVFEKNKKRIIDLEKI